MSGECAGTLENKPAKLLVGGIKACAGIKGSETNQKKV
jgi:hypothetical protein